MDQVVSAATGQAVVSGGTPQRDRSEREGRGRDPVVTGAAGQQSRLDRIENVAAASGELRVGQRLVGVAELLDPVTSRATVQAVVSQGPSQGVVSRHPRESHLAGAEPGRIDQVVACATCELSFFDPEQQIGTLPAEHRIDDPLVRVGLLPHQVDALGTDQAVVAAAAHERVVALAAVERDGAQGEGLGVEGVVAAAAAEPGEFDARELVGALAGQLRVGQRLVGVDALAEQVGAGTAGEGIVAGATVQRRVSAESAGVQHVVGPTAIQLGLLDPHQRIIAVADQRVVGEDLVGGAGRDDSVGATATHQVVVSGGSVQRVVAAGPFERHRSGAEARRVQQVVSAATDQVRLVDIREGVLPQATQRSGRQHLVGVGGLQHQVDAAAAQERIVAVASFERRAAGEAAGVECIGRDAAGQMNRLDIDQQVVADSADRGIGEHKVDVSRGHHQVDAVSPVDQVVSGRTDHRVVAAGSGQRDGSGIESECIERVVRVAAGDHRLLDAREHVGPLAGHQVVGQHLVGILGLPQFVDSGST